MTRPRRRLSSSDFSRRFGLSGPIYRFFRTRSRIATLGPPVRSGGTTLALLDRETRGLHAEADRGCHRLLRDGANRDDYVHQLTVTYGFEVPFEAACSYTPGLGQLIDLRGRA